MAGQVGQRYRSDIRRQRVSLKVRRIGENRYRITDTKGRGLEYRKRADFTPETLFAIDAAAGREVIVTGWLNRFGRWSIGGPDEAQKLKFGAGEDLQATADRSRFSKFGKSVGREHDR